MLTLAAPSYRFTENLTEQVRTKKLGHLVRAKIIKTC